MKTVEEVEGWDAGAFAVHFVESVGGEDGEGVKSLCTKGERNGTFVVAELCGALVRASSTNAEVKLARVKVKTWLSGPEIVDEIREGEKSGAKGVKVLLDAITAL